jgi:hypothetical protein
LKLNNCLCRTEQIRYYVKKKIQHAETEKEAISLINFQTPVVFVSVFQLFGLNIINGDRP